MKGCSIGSNFIEGDLYHCVFCDSYYDKGKISIIDKAHKKYNISLLMVSSDACASNAPILSS
ncbi:MULTISPECIES: hypothetical protein [Candidatus Ichthyocystis]|uniref:Uncharacterized protein n=1 Tax=Candidatus Ichthyocystis hellenicum TaxID=1561003 RepID=A0A0S4M3Y4_9BURK|nr:MULTISPECIES: hypothetical protein [Ichthyocystis]CUT17554.1 hypothetical protein Ark11_0719 [Candidatus Ichthyocystis hellenicum]